MNSLNTIKLLYSLQTQGVVLWCEDGEKLNYSSTEPISNAVLLKIKENKQELVNFLTSRQINKSYQIPYIFALNATEYTLSPAQERLWFLAQLQEKENYIYNEPLALTFEDQFDIELLRKTILILIERHACFRTIFKKDANGIPMQIILPFSDERVQSIATLHEENIDDQEISMRIESKLKQVFDLSNELSLKCYLYHLKTSNKYVLYILQHHIITDGTSIGLFLGELHTIYNSLIHKKEVVLAKIDIQYTDYALWFKEYFAKDKLTNQLLYWKNKLDGFQILQIQKDFAKSSDYRSLTYKCEIDSTLCEDLKNLAKNNSTTLFVTLLAAFYILLHRYTNQTDIVVGTPINGRNLTQVNNILGFFINTIVLRSKIKKQSIRNFLSETNQLYLEALQYQDLPFEMLVDSMAIDRDKDLTPIFQVMFAYQKFVVPGIESKNASTFDNFSEPATKFDLTFDFKETNNNVIVNVQYKANLFLSERIARMSNQYLNILKQMVQFPERNTDDINVLTDDEYNKLIYQSNSSRRPYLKDKTINYFFEEHVVKTPDRIAATYAGSSLTYFDLNEKANNMARVIRWRYQMYYKSELPPDTLIVIAMESGLELVVAILAVIKAGGAYVPIDVNYPQKRKSFILQDTAAKLIITKQKYFTSFEEIVGDRQKILVLDNGLEMGNFELQNNHSCNDSNNIVYVIYTSGSTGNPKGVCITHLSLNNYVANITNLINCTDRKILTVSSFTFDMFCFDFFCSLCSGGTLVLTDNVMVREPDALVKYIEDNKPDIMIATPSLWHMIIDKLTPAPNLTILSAGELLQENLAKKLFNITTEVWDAYGPTETTVFSILKKLSPSEQLSIGKPIPNVTAYILNENFQPVPIGVVGELYIGGDCLAKGYLNRPELTAERFIANPFLSDEERRNNRNLKIYKTGDLVYWLPTGDIKYVGRNDFQVKIAGHRIEIEELEFVLNQFPDLKQCFVLPITSESSMQLVVYYSAEYKIDENTLREHLAKSLPAYMIPNVFIYLERFPVNNNGKIDVKSLPSLNQANLSEPITLPRNSIEEELKQIFASVLKLESFSIDKNIFDMGCDSLKAVQVQTKINNHFKAKLKVVDIFYYPTIEKLALLLNDKVVETENPNVSIKNSGNGPMQDEIAIIGYSCAFPMSNNVEDYWNNISAGRECISRLEREECIQRGVSPSTLNHTDYAPYAGVIRDFEMFDAEFWELSNRDVQFMDPKMRLFLEQAWKAIESSGYIKKRKQISMGLFASFGKLDYLERLLQTDIIKQSITYFDYSMLRSADYFLNRIAYLLGITGPLLSVDTACSSAAVAVIEGCGKLLAGECDVAVVGGVNLCSADDFGHIYYDGVEFLSKDGHSRIFDEKGGGIVRSDGVGVVVLKRLSEAVRDQDHIKAVIKGYGISHDGMRKFGNMYPRLSSLKNCIADAQHNLAAENIDYVECHGMGFKLGELFEFDALRGAFKPKDIKKCLIGSVKANIGHTGYASGIAQLIKLVCMLEHRMFVPQINFDYPYTEFNLENEQFQISKVKHEWQKDQHTPRMAGMTSFGIGGTNAHIVLEEAARINQSGNNNSASNFLISMSAKSAQSLRQMRYDLANYLNSHSELNISDVAYTLHLAREEFNHRIAFVCHDIKTCIRILQSNDANMRLSTMELPGQNENLIFYFPDVMDNPTTISQDLYQSMTSYRNAVDHCTDILQEYLSVDIRERNSKHPDQYSTLLSLINNYATARLLSACGFTTNAIFGEGVGEYLAACLRGIISVADMFRFVLMLNSDNELAQTKAFAQSLQEITQGVVQFTSPDSTCITFAKNTSTKFQQHIINVELLSCNSSNEVDDYAYFLGIISKLWLQGFEVNWECLYSDKAGRFIELPNYVFAKTLVSNYQGVKNYDSQPIYT